MGSDSDWKIMQPAKFLCDEFGIKVSVKILSAHRTPHDLVSFVKEADDSGAKIFIAGAGGAAHLPGMVAALTLRPVIGVPINATSLSGMDALLSIVQMPKGIPVATVAIDQATNAAILGVQILALSDAKLHKKLKKYREHLAQESRLKNKVLK